MNETDMNTAIYETEAEATRERIASTVDDLQNRLSPRNMMSSAMGSVRGRSSDIADGALAFVREHPTAVAGAALALGVGLLLLNRDRFSGYSAEYNAYADVYGDDGYDEDSEGYDADADEGNSMMTRVRDTAASTGSSFSDRAASARSFASDKWSSARERSSDYAQRARARASTMRVNTVQRVHANPLGSVVTGLAAGALLGMLLPRTRRENELLGETRDRLAEAARQAAKAAADASRQQLDQMGVNSDAAKSKLADIGQQAKEVARTAGQAAASELKSQSGSAGGGTAAGTPTPAPTL